jgi:hypothetical protein
MGFVEIITHSIPLVLQSNQDGIDSRGTWAAPAPESSMSSAARPFPMAVIPNEAPRLVVYRGIPDQFNEADAVVRFVIPADAFARESEEAQVIFNATLMDGSALPSWLVFDRANGTFSGVAPRGFTGELKIKVVARNSHGQQAEAVFRFFVGKNSQSSSGKAGFSEQLRGMAYLNSHARGLDLARK